MAGDETTWLAELTLRLVLDTGGIGGGPPADILFGVKLPPLAGAFPG